MSYGILLVRIVVGLAFVGHGTQKLFGWFGGYGPDGTGQFFESLGLRPGRRTRSPPARRRPAAASWLRLAWPRRWPPVACRQ